MPTRPYSLATVNSTRLRVTRGCSCLKVAAGQVISDLKVKIMNASALDKNADRNAYKILDAPAGYAGRFDDSALPAGWGLKYAADGVYLRFNKGLMLIIR